jgi:uncharacterized protein YfdQ (DUF2303 family)
MENHKEGLEVILNAGKASCAPMQFFGSGRAPEKQVVVVPNGYSVQEIETEELNPSPYRTKGATRLATVDSFIAYVERELIGGSTVCFANEDKGSFEAVFNYSGGCGIPGWGDSKALLTLQQTTNWKRWMGLHGSRIGQLKFCDFVEANIDDIVSPDAATIIEMVTTLKLTRNASFTSVVDPRTGFATVNYIEKTTGENGGTGAGQAEFQNRMVIGLNPFKGKDSSRFTAKANLRFELPDGDNPKGLVLHFSIINHENVLEAAFKAECDKVFAKMDELKIPVFDI